MEIESYLLDLCIEYSFSRKKRRITHVLGRPVLDMLGKIKVSQSLYYTVYIFSSMRLSLDISVFVFISKNISILYRYDVEYVLMGYENISTSPIPKRRYLQEKLYLISQKLLSLSSVIASFFGFL